MLSPQAYFRKKKEKEELQKLAKLAEESNMNDIGPNSPITNIETLSLLEKATLKTSLSKYQKKFKIRERNTINTQKEKQEIINAVLELSKVLDITDENDEMVTQEYMELKSMQELLDMFDEVLEEAKKLI